MIHPTRTAGLCFLTLAQAGCGAGWRRTGELAPGALSPQQQVQVWHEGRAERLHRVVVSADSISGIPYLRPGSCDSCQVAIPLQAVDSVRLGHPELGFWKSVGVVLGGAAVLGVVGCAFSIAGDCQLGE